MYYFMRAWYYWVGVWQIPREEKKIYHGRYCFCGSVAGSRMRFWLRLVTGMPGITGNGCSVSHSCGNGHYHQLYLQRDLHFSSSQAGLLLFPFSILSGINGTANALGGGLGLSLAGLMIQVAGIKGWSAYGAGLGILILLALGAIGQLLVFYLRSRSGNGVVAVHP